MFRPLCVRASNAFLPLAFYLGTPKKTQHPSLHLRIPWKMQVLHKRRCIFIAAGHIRQREWALQELLSQFLGSLLKTVIKLRLAKHHHQHQRTRKGFASESRRKRTVMGSSPRRVIMAAAADFLRIFGLKQIY